MISKRAIIGPLLSIVFISAFALGAFGIKEILSKVEGKYYLASVSGMDETSNESNVEKIELDALSAISVQVNSTGSSIIFEKNSEEKLPIASITKLMTAIIAIDNYNLVGQKTISENVNFLMPMEVDLKPGDKVFVRNLLEMALINSSNRAAYSLAEIMGVQEFVGKMNQKAVELGLKNTFFTDPAGLDRGNVSTAKDLVILADYILRNYPQISWMTSMRELEIEGIGKIVNTNQLLNEMNRAVCSKTGFTKEAKGCLLLAIKNEEKGNYTINIILGAEDRFLEMKKIIDKTNDNSNF